MPQLRARFEDGCLSNNKIYFFDNFCQTICEMELEKYHVMVLKKVENYPKIMVRRIFVYDNIVCLVGRTRGQGLFVYDVKNDELAYYGHDDIKETNDRNWTPFFFEGKVFLLPHNSKYKIIEFDLKRRLYIEKEALLDRLSKNEEFDIFFPTGKGGYSTIVNPHNNRVLIYNFILHELRDKRIEGENILPFTALYDRGKLWIITKDGKIIYMENDFCQVIDLEIEKPAWVFLLKKYICVTLDWDNKIVLVNKEDFLISEVRLPFDAHDMNKSVCGSNFSNCIETDEYLYLIPKVASNMYRVTKKTLKAERITAEYDNKTIIRHNLCNETCLISETRDFSLEDFMDLLVEE